MPTMPNVGKKATVVGSMVGLGIFLVVAGLGLIPYRWSLSGWAPPLGPTVSEIGALVIVLAFVVAWKWNPEPSK